MKAVRELKLAEKVPEDVGMFYVAVLAMCADFFCRRMVPNEIDVDKVFRTREEKKAARAAFDKMFAVFIKDQGFLW